VTIRTDIKLNIRVQCMGPGFDDKSEPFSDDIILIEVVGGYSGPDLIGLQLKFKNETTVCTYDRAGFGKSWQSTQGEPSRIYDKAMR
jgi:hypothetical protein